MTLNDLIEISNKLTEVERNKEIFIYCQVHGGYVGTQKLLYDCVEANFTLVSKEDGYDKR